MACFPKHGNALWEAYSCWTLRLVLQWFHIILLANDFYLLACAKQHPFLDLSLMYRQFDLRVWQILSRDYATQLGAGFLLRMT